MDQKKNDATKNLDQETETNGKTATDPGITANKEKTDTPTTNKSITTPQQIVSIVDSEISDLTAKASPKKAKEMLKNDEYTQAYISDIADGMKHAIGKFSDTLNEIKNNPALQEIRKTLQKFVNTLQENQGKIEKLMELTAQLNELEPFIRQEFKERLKENPDLDNLSMPDFFKTTNENGEQIKSLWEQILETAKIRATLPQLQSTSPKYHTSPNTRLANTINDLIGAGEGNLPVENEGKKNEITTYISVDYEDSGAISIQGKVSFTEYDRQVMDGVCSAIEYGHKSHFFTPAIVFRAMVGDPTAKPSPQQQGAVTKSIEKMRRIFANVDATDEVQAYLKRKKIKDANNVTCKWNDALLSLRVVEVKNGRTKIRAYYPNAEPLLLSYGKATGKILTSQSNALDIKEVDENGKITENSLSNTEGHIAIKGYLWRRVLQMKYDEKKALDAQRKYNNKRKRENPKLKKENQPLLPVRGTEEFRKQHRTIPFNTLFKKTGQTTENRAQQKRNREYAFQVLDYWKAKGYIKGYKKQIGKKNGKKAITGIKIQI